MIIKENILNNGWHIIKFSDCIKQLNTGLNPRKNFSLGSGKLKYITAKNLTKFGTIDFSKCDLFYIFYDKPLLGAGLGYISIIKEFYSFIGFGMTLTYNGERGKQYKWFNYFFYPVHILILGLLRIYLNI